MEFDIEEQTYQIGKINAKAQFHIIRRLAPILGDLVPTIQGGDDGTAAIAPLAAAIAKLSDDDADYVIFGLLKAVSRKQSHGLGWGPVSTNNQLMYDDISMTAMLQIAWKAFSYNMQSFLAAIPSLSKDANQKANAK